MITSLPAPIQEMVKETNTNALHPVFLAAGAQAARGRPPTPRLAKFRYGTAFFPIGKALIPCHAIPNSPFIRRQTHAI